MSHSEEENSQYFVCSASFFRLNQKDQIFSNPSSTPCQKKSEIGWLPPPPWVVDQICEPPLVYTKSNFFFFFVSYLFSLFAFFWGVIRQLVDYFGNILKTLTMVFVIFGRSAICWAIFAFNSGKLCCLYPWLWKISVFLQVCIFEN